MIDVLNYRMVDNLDKDGFVLFETIWTSENESHMRVVGFGKTQEDAVKYALEKFDLNVHTYVDETED